MARVSVIIPTYNRADLVGEAINSVISQTYCDHQIIVVDDGSTDHTAEVVERFGPEVNYILLDHCGQPAATRNAGMRAASGEFVAFLDSDDLFLPGKIALQVAALEAHPDLGLVYSNGRFFKDNVGQSIGHVQDGLPTPSGKVFGELLRGNFMSIPVVLVRRSCLDDVGLFDERVDFFAVEDYELWLRIAARFRVLYVPGVVAAIRCHRHSISRDVSALRRRVLCVLRKMDDLHPQLMLEHRGARHQGYALNHGAIAVAEFQQRHLGLAIRHGCQALSHTVRMPGMGLGTFVGWWRRHHQRRGIGF